ncbi:MAG: hypothetical protein ACOYLB_07000 [Phototrophicaceae bacterium]
MRRNLVFLVLLLSMTQTAWAYGSGNITITGGCGGFSLADSVTMNRNNSLPGYEAFLIRATDANGTIVYQSAQNNQLVGTTLDFGNGINFSWTTAPTSSPITVAIISVAGNGLAEQTISRGEIVCTDLASASAAVTSQTRFYRVFARSGMNMDLYREPNTNSKLRTLLYNGNATDYALLDENNGFYQITIPDVGNVWVQRAQTQIRWGRTTQLNVAVITGQLPAVMNLPDGTRTTLPQGTEGYILSSTAEITTLELLDGRVGTVSNLVVQVRTGTFTDTNPIVVGATAPTSQASTVTETAANGSTIIVSASVAPNAPAPAVSGNNDQAFFDSLPGYGITNFSPMNMRSGAGAEYTLVGITSGGYYAEMLGRNEQQTWWLVKIGSISGWVNAEFMLLRGDLSHVPVLEGNGELITPTIVTYSATVVYNQPTNLNEAIACNIPQGQYEMVGRDSAGVYYQIEAVCDNGSSVIGWLRGDMGALRNPANVILPVKG